MNHHRYYRYIGYGILTLILTLLPFIQIQGNQIFLLSFDHKELHLLGVVFGASELYLLPFLLVLLFVGIFFLTTLGGRMWCGWSCPQTIFRVIFRDLIETKILGLRKSIANKQKNPDYHEKINVLKKFLAIALFFVIALMASATFLFYFVPPRDFFAYMADPLEHGVLLGFWLSIAAFMTFDITFMAENFCVYVCPYARVQSVLFDDHTLMAIYDAKRGGSVYDESGSLLPAPKKQDKANECTNCQHCVKVCPAHIDIRKGMQLECINCLECVDACAEVMAKFSQPSLVQWSSAHAIETKSKVKYFRGKTIAYLLVLAVILVSMLVMGQKKEPVLVSIDRNTELYKVRQNGDVDNFYIFLLENTDKKDHRYYFKITNQDSIAILRPSEPIEVAAGSKIKQVVILRSQAKHSANPTTNKSIALNIEIFATDDDKIKVQRQSVFVMPE